jgi:hypothetical protein
VAGLIARGCQTARPRTNVPASPGVLDLSEDHGWSPSESDGVLAKDGKNGHTERPPMAQIIVNGKPVTPPADEPVAEPGPDYEEGGRRSRGGRAVTTAHVGTPSWR